jgi:precorrin-4 C11-methyltransferase
MMKTQNALIAFSDAGYDLAKKLCARGFKADIYQRHEADTALLFSNYNSLIFIGALGICVRQIAPYLKDKASDPAIVNIDAHGQFVQAVAGGHHGGANELTKHLAALLGAIPVITTVSDTSGLWPLDLLAKRYGWAMESPSALTPLMAGFINRQPTALLLEARDAGTLFLENSLPDHVTCFYNYEHIATDKYALILAVTPFERPLGKNTIYYRPPMLHMGLGCQAMVDSEGLKTEVLAFLRQHALSPLSLKSIGTIDMKSREKALLDLAAGFHQSLTLFEPEKLRSYSSENPSEFVESITGTSSVAEACACLLANNLPLIGKLTLKVGPKFATIALALDQKLERKGFVEIIGAGPGDPALITVQGKNILQTADLILYAGSLVPVELTQYAKAGCTIRNSATMDLSQQIACMKGFTDRNLLVARLHTGDPCIYGAIQEQMAVLDQLGIPYRITPGVSAFQAAAAVLKSQFTIPEDTQTIILTRGEGRTKMPEREQLNHLARSQSTMCLFLSATLAGQVQRQLLEHYPPDTPVAICHKLTWPEEKVVRCTLSQLSEAMKTEGFTLTTLIVVGRAIDNREGLSRLYAPEFKHLYRP